MSTKTFPAGLVLHPEEVRVAGDAITNETRWVPGALEQDGKFRYWTRFLLGEGEALTHEALSALPLRMQRCIADNRGTFRRLFGGHGQEVAFQMDAPIGDNGKIVKVDVLTKRPEDGVAVWSLGGNERPAQDSVAATLPANTPLEQLGNAWLARGEAAKLLQSWSKLAPPSPPPAARSTAASSTLPPSEMSLPQMMQFLGERLHSLDLRAREGTERQMEDRIAAAFDAFGRFQSALEPRIAALPRDTQPRRALADTMRIPFIIAAENASNPLRNGEVAKRVAQDLGVPVEVLTFSLQHPYHVCFEDLPPHVQFDAQFVTAFTMMRRTMILPPHLDLRDQMFPLVQFHEFIHVYQHAQHRKKWGLPEYIRFTNQNDKPCLVGDEVQAYGYEIEAANLMLDGRLRADALAGRTIDHDDVRRRLGIGDQYRVPIQFLSYNAALYYRDNREDGVYPPAYVESVLRCIVHDGQTPYQMGQSGKPERIG